MSSWIPALFNSSSGEDNPTSPSSSTPKSPSVGIKEDLSAVFRGVGAFIAPLAAAASVAGPPCDSSADAISGIKNDLAEIRGSLKSGLSLISSRFTSNFLQFQSQENDDDDDDSEEEEGIMGISEEVVEFVRKISGRPELWIDFPLPLPDDFGLSDSQREHAEIIDDLVPGFVILRKKLLSQLSDGKFWLIYFVLLFPRLNEEELMLLSSPEVVEARETLLEKLLSKAEVTQETSENPESSNNEDSGKQLSKEGDEIASGHVETVNATKEQDTVDEMESRHPPEEVDTSSADAQQLSQNEDDVSFSDLEDDDNDLSGKLSETEKSLPAEPEWVRLHETSGGQGAKPKPNQSTWREKESEGEDSSDWLTVDDTDFDNLAEV